MKAARTRDPNNRGQEGISYHSGTPLFLSAEHKQSRAEAPAAEQSRGTTAAPAEQQHRTRRWLLPLARLTRGRAEACSQPRRNGRTSGCRRGRGGDDRRPWREARRRRPAEARMGGAAQTGAGREQGPARTGAGQGRGMARTSTGRGRRDRRQSSWTGMKTGGRRPLPHASRDGRLQNGLLAARNARIRRRTACGGRRQWISGGVSIPNPTCSVPCYL